MNKAKLFKHSLAATLVASALTACGGGGSSSNDPKPENVPVTPASTTAEISGSAIKGAMSGADITVTALNGSKMTMKGDGQTDNDGNLFVELTGEPGFGIKSVVKMSVVANATTTMTCDAPACGSASLGGTVKGAAIDGSTLTTMGYLSVGYGSSADGSADATMQANALTTLSTDLIEKAAAEGRNIASADLLALAQAEYSSVLLRAIGWQTSGVNVFTTPVVAADSYANFVADTTCETVEQTDDEGNPVTDEEGNPVTEDVCTDTLVDANTIRLSVLNAAFANFDEGYSLKSNLQTAGSNLEAALSGNPDALASFRQSLYGAIMNHEVVATLGMTADQFLDLELALFDGLSSGGPVQEVTTDANMAGAVITARNRISDGEAETMAFDGNAETKWLDHNDWSGPPSVEDPSWVQVQFEQAHAVNSVFITSANDAPSRDPENFNVLASNDGESWVTLAEFVGESFDERFERKEFKFSNGLKYSHYRINITKNKGDDGLMQLGEIQFVGPIYPSVDHSDTVDVSAITGRNRISDGEAEAMAFDGNAETKWLDHNDWSGPPTEDDPSWIQVDFAEGVAVDTLAITSANDAPSRDPENFTLVGSNDGGTTWVTLASFLGESFDDRFERKTFSVPNALAYSTYRLNITKNKGDDGLMQLGEIELIGPEMPGLNHAMTAGTTITARNRIGDAESEAMAFDGNAETKWLDHNDWSGPPTAEDPSWVEVALPEMAAVNTLAITSANDAPARDPENFDLLGSNDGTNWLTLASWVGESFDERFERKQFTFSNGLGYSHYRLNITKNKGDDGLMQVGEIELIGPQYQLVDHSSASDAVYSARNRIGDAESEAMVFDDNAETKWLDHNDWSGPPSAEDPSWVQVDFDTARIVSSLAITSANDAPSRDPENFNIMGSNDGGQTWEKVTEFVGESWDNRFERKLFEFGNGFAYTSYRINITKNKGDDGLMQIAEIELIGPQL